MGRLCLIDDTGRQIVAPAPLPVDANWFPTGQSLNPGLVLEVAYGPGPSGQSEIWQPTSNHVIWTLPSPPLAARGDWIATESAKSCLPDCSIQITDIRSDQVKVIPLPSTNLRVRPRSSITRWNPARPRRDYERKAATMAIGRHCRGPGRCGPPQCCATPTQLFAPRDGDPPISWSSNDGWLFATRIGGSDVLAWRSGLSGMAVLTQGEVAGSASGSTQSSNRQIPDDAGSAAAPFSVAFGRVHRHKRSYFGPSPSFAGAQKQDIHKNRPAD